MSKKVNLVYAAKIAANRKHKEIVGSLNKLQKIALEYYEGTENLDFRKMCDELKLSKSDIQFSHVLKFGTNRELNFVDKTGQLTGKKSVFSFWLFESCLIRYANSLQAAKPAKVAKVTKDQATAKPPIKTVKIEQKEVLKPAKVA
jgi:hypothetical protein